MTTSLLSSFAAEPVLAFAFILPVLGDLYLYDGFPSDDDGKDGWCFTTPVPKGLGRAMSPPPPPAFAAAAGSGGGGSGGGGGAFFELNKAAALVIFFVGARTLDRAF